jgi:hypothetical protein
MKSATVDARGGLRTVSGSVASNGIAQNPGSNDWTVAKTATGTFVLRFSPPFRGVPVITTSPIGSAIVGTNPVSADSATVLTVSGAFAAMDAGFYFHAEGRTL